MSIQKLPPINVLLCIHSAQISGPLYQYFTKFGAASVTIADSRVQVNSAIRKQNYDFFMIDQNLPGVSGINLLEYLKISDVIDDDSTTVLCMNMPKKQEILRAKSLGVSSIIIPPFSIQKIGERIQKLYEDTTPLHFPSAPNRPVQMLQQA